MFLLIPISQSFRVDKKLYKGLIEISSPDEIRFYRLEQYLQLERTTPNFYVNNQRRHATQNQFARKYRKKKKLKRKMYYLEGNDYEGFLALNQPIYKPGDTVKLKGFVVDQSGKALNRALDLYLGFNSEKLNSSGQARHIQRLEAVSPGAYVHEFVLADSLVLDKSYTLMLATPDSQTLVSNDLYLEEYLLNEVSWNLTVNPYLKKGDSLNVWISGTDANGLSLQDGWVTRQNSNLPVWMIPSEMKDISPISFMKPKTALERSGKNPDSYS